MGKMAVSKLVYFITIVITFLLAAITVVGAFASSINPADNHFMGYLGIILPGLLILNILSALYWGIRWRRWIWFPIISLAANFGYLSAVFQISGSNSTRYQTIKTATLNAHSFNNEITGYTIKEMARFFEDEKIDIICFQEFRANKEFPLDSILTIFSPSFNYVAIPEGGGSLAIFSKHPIVANAAIPFPGETNNSGMWADININNKKTRVVNVHMQTNNLARSSSKLKYRSDNERISLLSSEVVKNFTMRAEQADLVRSIVDKSDNPILLCGDFNDTPASYTYKHLKGDLKDGFKSAGNGYEYTFRGGYNLLRIDYIFHSDDLKAVRYYSPGTDWSDHHMIILETEIP